MHALIVTAVYMTNRIEISNLKCRDTHTVAITYYTYVRSYIVRSFAIGEIKIPQKP